ncbi:MAG TPA: hypothetical protein VFX06_07505 [Stellaceae bacterium]|nr:hypothetical protein [Stellaceae bacterium]
MRFALSVAALMAAAPAGALADCNHPEALRPGDSTAASGAGGAVECYQVALQAGEPVSIAIDSPRNDVVFAVFAPGWRTSCDAAGDCDVAGDQLGDDAVTRWADTAPATGSYLIVIDTSRSDADYRLSVELR